MGEMTRELPASLLMFIAARAAADRIFGVVRDAGFHDVTLAQSRLLMGVDPEGTRLSVLADREFFGGGPELVQLIANEPRLTLPLLYKEFVVDPQQIYRAGRRDEAAEFLAAGGHQHPADGGPRHA